MSHQAPRSMSDVSLPNEFNFSLAATAGSVSDVNALGSMDATRHSISSGEGTSSPKLPNGFGPSPQTNGMIKAASVGGGDAEGDAELAARLGRLEKNRVAARKCRLKKNAQMQRLQEERRTIMQDNERLREENQKLKDAKNDLIAKLSQFQHIPGVAEEIARVQNGFPSQQHPRTEIDMYGNVISVPAIQPQPMSMTGQNGMAFNSYQPIGMGMGGGVIAPQFQFQHQQPVGMGMGGMMLPQNPGLYQQPANFAGPHWH